MDVGVRRRGFCRVSLRLGPIKTGFENGGDRGIGDGVDDQRPLARRFQAIRLVTVGKGQRAEGRAISLFGMRTIEASSARPEWRCSSRSLRPGSKAMPASCWHNAGGI